MDSQGVEIRELRSIARRHFEDMGNGYTSNAKYAVRRAVTGGQITFAIQLIQLDRPYVKEWPCREEYIAELSKILKHGMSFGAFAGDRLVGVAIAEPRSWNNTLWVETIHIDAVYRRAGIGSRLLRKVEAMAKEKEFRVIGLEVQNTNAPAVAFYQKMGFVLDGLDASLYFNNDDFNGEIAFFMKKHLL